MALLGDAALAMWWDIEAPVGGDFGNWHSHEHFPERMAIEGFRRGSRAVDAGGGPGVFVLYELASHAVFTSAPYRARLDAPTPWSTKLMPEHRRMVRSPCHVAESHGGGAGGWTMTLRLSPAAGRAEALAAHLRPRLGALARRPGLYGAHLLMTEVPAERPTLEQQIRGGDAAADWIVLLQAYDRDALGAVGGAELTDGALELAGAAPGIARGTYAVALVMTPADVAGPAPP